MSDIQGGESFSDGQSFNAARANNHVNGATILSGFFSDKAAVTHGDVVPSSDVLLLRQASSSLLKKITVAEFLLITGNVSSVGLTMPDGFTVTGSPVTGAGTLGVTLGTQADNKHLASPADGSEDIPTFRERDPRDSRYPSVEIAADAIDWALGNLFRKGLTNDITFSFAHVEDGAEIVVLLSNDGFTATWPTVYWADGVVPAPTTGLNQFRFTCNGAAIFGKLEIENAS